MRRTIFIIGFVLLSLPGMAKAPKIKIACIGNSITFGSGMPNPATMSYPVQLQYWMGNDYEVRNYGVGGATLLKKGDKPYWMQEEFKEALEFKPDIVLIKLGTNDSKPQNWVYEKEFDDDYEDMVRKFRQLPSMPRILLILPVPVFAEEKWGIRDSVVSEVIVPRIKNIADKTGCEIIDLNTPLKDYGQFFPDKVHPDPIGATIMTEIIYRKLFHKTKEDNGGYFNPCIHPVPSFEYRSGAGWGEGNYWMSQHLDINSIGKTRKPELVFLGNSITQSWGGEGRNVWSAAPELWDSLYKPLNAANFGISGDRTQNVLWRIENGNFDNINPELIVLAIGVNNFRHNTAADIAEGIAAIVKSLKGKIPSSKILLLGPFPAGATRSDPMREKYREVHALIAPLGNQSNVIYMNIGKGYINTDGSLNYKLMRKDNVHLTTEGYYRWAESIQPVIDDLFGSE